jgi:putative N-acetyltransferase (TIGR04045 family)
MIAPPIVCRVARAPWELDAYHRLRRAIFCDEQRLFAIDDRDAWDAIAVPIVAVRIGTGGDESVAGVVRIYEASPGVWYGGRLGVETSHRSTSHVGRSLVVKAVTTARAWGCREFLAVVQTPNVPFFERLHWRALEALEAHGIAHTKMVADLEHYPASEDADVAWRPKASSYDAA